MTEGERAELRGVVLGGRYAIGARLAIGGTGVVFTARDMVSGEDVVVKTLRPMFVGSPDLGRRLRREAEVSRRVRHPGIVPVTDEGTLDDGSPFLVMERARGESIHRLLRRYGTIELTETVALAMRVADILHAAHRQGYVHRDVKPEHIIVSRAPLGDLRVQLLDFGVCSAACAPPDERAREKGRVFGTPSYVSPEQASGNPEVDGRADVFSLGVFMFECLTGELPFEASNVMNLLRRIIREDAPRIGPLMPRAPRSFDGVLARALARIRDERFPNARALAHALLPFVGTRIQTERNVLARTEMAPAAALGGAPRERTTAVTAVAA